MNRTGSITDVPLLITFLFVLAIVVTSGAEIMDRLNMGFQEDDTLSNRSQEQFSTLNTRYSQVWDGAFALVVALFTISLVLSTAALGTRPEFFFILIIISMFLVGVAAVISNVFADFTTTLNSSVEFTFLPLFMNNLVEVLLVLLALLFIGLYVKIRGVV